MNRRKFEILFGLASGAVGFAVALYTAVMATPREKDAAPETAPEESGVNEERDR